ncbi:ribosomal protein subunit L31 [Niveomyces insectorum RCEF 264]|uniref:Large ribosomal subunit protein mL60 n=1 Tax=Niveomyces insectorum RCEF 264 TaxID=1081102 RepID=A0A167Y2H7_9HYPO|nr:ribosomal protein subunit L31 [Niveomyces insectorum RCEF 264]
MFGLGPFRVTNPLSGGLLWKIPWRLSRFQKYRHRKRLRAVDSVIETLDAALAKQGTTIRALERWKDEMPTEPEMLPRDKYTLFDRKAKRYRKGIHRLPKWTRVSQRINPPGY